LTVPFNQHADRGIDFYVAAGDHRPVEVKVERAPRRGAFMKFRRP
jgi:hypothetical protein